jgi:hypothetical protein
MTSSTVRSTLLAALAPLAVCAILLTSPVPAAQAAPAERAASVAKEVCQRDGWFWFILSLIFKDRFDCVGDIDSTGPGHGGGGNISGPPDPAETPELGSLVLFGSGAAGFAGYTLSRLRSKAGR